MQQQVTRVRAAGVFAIIGAIVLTMILMAPSSAYAEPSSAEKQAEAQAALAALNTMQSQLDQASNDYYLALDEQAQAEASRDEAQGRIDEASVQIADLQQRLGQRATSMYRSGGLTFLDLLLGATSFDEFATMWDLLNNLNENDADLVQQTKDLRAEIEEQKAVFDEQQRIASQKAAEAKSIEEEAAATVATMQATYSSLSAEAAQLLEQERAAQQAIEAAAAQQVVAAATRQDATTPSYNNGGGGTGNGEGAEISGGTGNGGGTEISGGGESSGGEISGGGESGGGDGGYSSFTPSYNPVTGNAIVDRAYGCLGAGYDYNTCGPSTFDCSGLVSYAVTGSYSRLGSTYTFLGYQQVYDPQPGDIAVNSGHCGIYIGGGQMIHAATYGVGVITGPVQGGMIFVRP